ncbi:endonuclease I family protein [Prevotella sp. AGR2160]|uniref:endonuclease I family protein n=1 Tax=Prevotella sp. AGR2160 TaxID=1280674 RepID=UPI0004279E8B|nr:endonuclease [Prevotella sp. AGR2160]
MYRKIIYLSLAALMGATIPAEAITRQQLMQYAFSLKGLKGAELKTAMRSLLAPKTVLSYGSTEQGTWWGFWYTDRDTVTQECINRYSSKKFYFSGHTGRAISGMNIEHSFPKSWWGGDKNNAYKDLYNLYPSDQDGNSAKANYPMAVVTNVKSEDPGYDKVGTGTVDGATKPCWEPGDQYKGDFARAYMYMAIAYSNLTFSSTGLQTMSNSKDSKGNVYPGMKQWATDLYRSWSQQDLVSDLERTRNNAVAKIEGNRNLLVDYPYLAEYVWGDSVNVAFNPYTSITTADDDDRYMTPTAIIAPTLPQVQIQTPIYNMQGQRVGADYRGIVISRGKKIIKWK